MLSLHCAELPDLPDQDEPAAAEHKGGAAQDRRRVRPTDLASGEEKGSIALYILDWLFKCGLRRSPASPFENGRARPNVDLANL